MNLNPHEFSSECKTYFEKKIKKLFHKRELQNLKSLSKEFQRDFVQEL